MAPLGSPETYISGKPRTLIKQRSFPWGCFGQLKIKKGSLRGVGSGVLIGPRHVLTAGHNLFNKFRAKQGDTTYYIPDQITFYPGRSGSFTPVKVYGMFLYIHLDWKKTRYQGSDLGMIFLDKESSVKGERKKTSEVIQGLGWLKITSFSNEELSHLQVHVTGYPGEKKPPSLYSGEGRLKTLREDLVTYPISTTPGQSGSAVWTYVTEGDPQVLGIHAYGAPKGIPKEEMENSAVRLNTVKKTHVEHWIRSSLKKLKD